MAKRLTVRGEKVTVWAGNRTTRLHITSGAVVFGSVTRAVCGRVMMVGLGGGKRTVAEWDAAHVSFKCQPCSAILKEHGNSK